MRTMPTWEREKEFQCGWFWTPSLCFLGKGQNGSLTPQTTRILERRNHTTFSLMHLFSLLFYLPRLLPFQRGQILTTPPFQAHLKGCLLPFPFFESSNWLYALIPLTSQRLFFETSLVAFGKLWPLFVICAFVDVHTCTRAHTHSLERIP